MKIITFTEEEEEEELQEVQKPPQKRKMKAHIIEIQQPEAIEQSQSPIDVMVTTNAILYHRILPQVIFMYQDLDSDNQDRII